MPTKNGKPQRLEKRIKQFIENIKSPYWRKQIRFFFRRLNILKRTLEDIKVMLSDVKLYKKDSLEDKKAQWQARLGRGGSYALFENYRDPDPEDFEHIRGDDLFFLNYFPKNCSILELGCGNGRLGYMFKKKLNVNYMGLDISSTAVEDARKKGVNAWVCDLDDLPKLKQILGDKRFDYVLANWTLQLLYKQEELIHSLFNYTDVQIHDMWNACHWSSRLRFLFGRFPIYSYAADNEGRHIYPYPYGGGCKVFFPCDQFYSIVFQRSLF